MSRFKAILFDCDGVLIDSEPMGCEALAQAVSAAGVAMTREEATRLFSGNAADASIKVMAALGLDAMRVFYGIPIVTVALANFGGKKEPLQKKRRNPLPWRDCIVL